MVLSANTERRAQGPKMAGKAGKPKAASAGFAKMAAQAKRASGFLKALSHESRLLILCLLCEGERPVTDLEALLSLRQSTVSQQLARLRQDGLVRTKRNGKSIHYSLANEDVRTILEALHGIFCKKTRRRAR